MTCRLALALCSALLAGLGTASAADLPRKAPITAPIVAPVYNWTGFYVGVHAGWVWSDVDASTTFVPPGVFLGVPFSYSHDADGGMLGGQIGFNYQISNWVFGIEADLSWTDLGSTVTVAPLAAAGFGPVAGTFQTSSVDMNWFGTARGRIGYAANNLLVYVTGGVAFAEFDQTVVSDLNAAFLGAVFTGSSSSTRAGWTIGGGFEWGFAPNWSVKAEYLYYDLGDTTVRTTSPGGLVPADFATVTTFDNTGHILRLGLNYRFGLGGGPVVARY